MSNGDDQGNTNKLTLSSPDQGLDAIHTLLEKVWTEAPFVDSLDRFSFETALIEMVSNVFQHSQSDVTPLCTVEIETYRDRIESTVIHGGPPKEIQLTGRTMPDESAESGRGILLIQALVSELRYTREGDYNRWHMIKKILPEDRDFSVPPKVSLLRPVNEKKTTTGT